MMRRMTNSNDLARRVGALFSSPRYQPLPERDLAKRLQLGPGQRGALRAALHELESQGRAAALRGGRWGPPPASAGQIEGTFRMRPNGSCWLTPDVPGQPPLWVDPTSATAVLDGDRIFAAPIRRPASARLFGAQADAQAVRVVRIVERKRQWVVGVLHATPHYAYLVPRDPLLRANIRLEGPAARLKPHLGHLVVARLAADEPAANRPVTAVFDRDLGDPGNVANDVPALLLDRGLSEDFPDDVARAAGQAHAQLVQHGADLRGRVDLRNRWIVTIDPATAHDYDDAVSIDPLPDGRCRLGVHIADVAAYVTPGSPIDREALRRGNSTYLVDRVIRMLPRDITVRVCSLQPNEDHLAHTVEIVFDAHGRAHEVRTFRSVIRSKACLAYEQVQEFFDTGRLDGVPAEVRRSLRALRELARKIRKERFRAGALDFALPEVKCKLDRAGHPVGFERRGATEAYNLIEECMLAANQAVARKVRAAGIPGIYRIHDEPTDEQWTRMAGDLRALGVQDPPENAADLNRIARSVAGKPEQYIVTLTLLRSMQRAVYAAACRPHFGLGFDCYAHFTSPIRRYPDLVLHRLLIGLEEGRQAPLYTAAEIEKLAAHCSETERESAELESQSLQIKRIRYYADLLRRGETGPFPGTVISLNPKGLIVELEDSLQQGMLPYHALGGERFLLAADGRAAAARTGARFRLGQPVRVGLAAVDEHAKRVDFFLPGAESRRPAGRHNFVRQKRPGKNREKPHIGVDKTASKTGNRPPNGAKHFAHPRRK